MDKMMSASMIANKRSAAMIGLVLVHLTIINTFTSVGALSNSSAPEISTKLNETLPMATSTPTMSSTTVSSTTTAKPASPTTSRVPSEQEINEARKIIQEVAAGMKNGSDGANGTISDGWSNFTYEALEPRLADATTQFGLKFINSFPSSAKENTVVSPVSLQILLNMILLGSDGPTRAELTKALGYDSTNLPSKNKNDNYDRINREWPHSTMNSLLESIAHATHSTGDEKQQLLNSDQQLAAHLQTTTRDSVASPTSPVNFTLANLMLTNQDRIKTNPDFENDLKRYYDVKLEHFSQPNTPIKAGEKPLYERINSWVLNITHNQISELVKKADLESDDLVMVLLNAAHFKGRWLHTFNSKQTHERLFYNEGQKTAGQEVKFMRQSGVFGYAEFGSSQMQSAGDPQEAGQSTTSDETVLTEDLTSGRTNDKGSEGGAPPVIELSKEEAKRFELTSNLNCTVLMMPFALDDGQELSMVFILPTKRDGLQDLLEGLNGPALNEIYRSLNEQHVQVEIPKFSFESSLDAKSTLEKMGITRIFQDGAELDLMLAANSPKGAAKVDKIVHKAKIAVDEEGAEAAAASAATIVLRNLIRPPNPVFVADHPFVFVIRHNRSNLPLFMGTIQRL